jgi:hypothetical protein
MACMHVNEQQHELGLLREIFLPECFRAGTCRAIRLVGVQGCGEQPK